MRASPGLALLLLAACGSGEPADREGPDANEIARLSRPDRAERPPGWSVRLDPIAAAPAGGCRFTAVGRLLLVTDGQGALVRLHGTDRRLTPSAPVGATGGFFEDRQLSASIGRDADAAEQRPGAWPARLTITNRRTEEQLRVEGQWACGP